MAGPSISTTTSPSSTSSTIVQHGFPSCTPVQDFGNSLPTSTEPLRSVIPHIPVPHGSQRIALPNWPSNTTKLAGRAHPPFRSIEPIYNLEELIWMVEDPIIPSPMPTSWDCHQDHGRGMHGETHPWKRHIEMRELEKLERAWDAELERQFELCMAALGLPEHGDNAASPSAFIASRRSFSCVGTAARNDTVQNFVTSVPETPLQRVERFAGHQKSLPVHSPRSLFNHTGLVNPCSLTSSEYDWLCRESGNWYPDEHQSSCVSSIASLIEDRGLADSHSLTHSEREWLGDELAHWYPDEDPSSYTSLKANFLAEENTEFPHSSLPESADLADPCSLTDSESEWLWRELGPIWPNEVHPPYISSMAASWVNGDVDTAACSLTPYPHTNGRGYLRAGTPYPHAPMLEIDEQFDKDINPYILKNHEAFGNQVAYSFTSSNLSTPLPLPASIQEQLAMIEKALDSHVHNRSSGPVAPKPLSPTPVLAISGEQWSQTVPGSLPEMHQREGAMNVRPAKMIKWKL